MRLSKLFLLLGILGYILLQMQTGIASGSISVEDADAVRNFSLNSAPGDALDSSDAPEQGTFIDVYVNGADAIRDFNLSTAPEDALNSSDAPEQGTFIDVYVCDADALRDFNLSTAPEDALDSSDAPEQETFIDVYVCDTDAMRDFNLSNVSAGPIYSIGQGAPTEEIKNHFIDAYNRNGGINVLGSPTTEVHKAWGYWVQDFPGASGYAGGIIMYNPYANYAYYIHGAIWDRYYNLGGPRAKTDIEFELGPPTSDIEPYVHTKPPEVSSHGAQFRYQNFEGGALDYNVDTGEVFEVHGAIFAKWRGLGYAEDELGLVTSDEREAAPSSIGTAGRVSDFEGGHIHWHRSGPYANKAFETHGAIDEVYCSEGGSGGWLGFPVSDEYMNPSGYAQSDFEGGYITTTDGVNYNVYMNDDDEGPILEITSPKDGFHTDEYRIGISGTASDDSGILYDKVAIASSGFDGAPRDAWCDPITHKWNTNLPLVYGNNVIKVVAWDNKHNPTEKTISVYCNPPDFRFVHLTDVHIGCDPKSIFNPLSLLTKKAVEEVDESIRRFAETLDAIGNLTPKPEVLLITGDLVEWNKESFFSAYKGILDSYIIQEKIKGHSISVYCVPGNHDRREWNVVGDDNLVNYHKYISTSDNYCFSQGGYRFIGLDSGKDYNVSAYWGVPFDPLTLTYDYTPESYGLSQEQIEFLQQEQKSTPKIIFMHHPAIEEIGKNDVKSHESVSEDPVPPNDPGGNDGCIAFKRPEFINYCKENNVHLVLTGHIHVDKFLDADGNPVRLYTNGYFGNVKPLFVQTRSATKDNEEFKHGYLDVNVKNDNIQLFSPSGTIVPPSSYYCSATGSVNIHAYDSQDRHTGYSSVDVNIPESFYTGNYNGSAPDMPQMILLYNTTEEYRFEIVANLTEEEKESPEIESFNFTVEQRTDDTRTIISYLNVPLTENTTVTLPINLTTTAYMMEIDHDGDGTTDETKDPDSIETNYAPTAAIIVPETGSIYNASEQIEFNGTGRDPEDGILTNFSLVWYSDINGVFGAGERFSTVNLTSGAHRITLFVNDSVDLRDTDSVMITVIDNTPPSSITNLTVNAGNTWINWTWTNPHDFDFNHTEIYRNGTYQTCTSTEFFNATDLVPNTEYTVSTRTVDTYGNINTTWVNDTATTLPALDTTPPIITITSPVNDTTYNIDSVDLNYTVNEPIVWQGYSLDGSANVTLYGNTTLTGLIDGLHSLTIYANDTYGNMNSSTVWFAIDTTPPIINTVTLNTTNPNTGQDILVTVNATDNFAVTNVTANSIALTHQGGDIWNGTITAIEGTHSVNVSAADDTGNIGWNNSTSYTTTTADITPPVVTNPTATPGTIIPDGIEETLLNITVTDESGIYAVTIDLSPIGGDTATVMENIQGTDVYTTTSTATVGTPPATYDLKVNATDNSPNKNSNKTVSIPLIVLSQQTVSSYDFETGAGVDKWAYRKQHNRKPPATNDVPKIEFTSSQYAKIMADDGVMQLDKTSVRRRYAVHRFNFVIDEPESCITCIDILWDGIGYIRRGSKGATLYVWNFKDGSYDKLSSGTSTYLTLEGSITENVGDYIGDDGTLTIIAEQNAPQRGFWRWVFPSRIGTDYLRVNVTYKPQPYLKVLDITPSSTLFHRGDDVIFVVEVINEGFDGRAYVGGAARYPDESSCNTEWVETSHLSHGDSASVYLNWSVPDDAPIGQYGFVSGTWDACWDGCEGSPCYLDGCCDGMQDRYETADLFEVVE